MRPSLPSPRSGCGRYRPRLRCAPVAALVRRRRRGAAAGAALAGAGGARGAAIAVGAVRRPRARVRDLDGPAGPLGRRPRDRVARATARVPAASNPTRDRRGRAGGRPRPGGAAARRGLRRRSWRPRSATRDLLRLRPARHRLLGPAGAAPRCTQRHAPTLAVRRCADAARRRARRLPHAPTVVRGPRGAARRGRLRQARPVRRLLRHEGRRGLRRGAPGPRRRRSSSTPSCRPRARTRSGARRCQAVAARARRAVRRRRLRRAITRERRGDLAARRRAAGAGPIRGAVYDAPRARYTAHLTQGRTGLLDILLAGDLNPTLRAELPGRRAGRAARRRQAAAAPQRALGGPDDTARRCRRPSADSDALFLATTCEESARCRGRAARRVDQRRARGRRARRAGAAARPTRAVLARASRSRGASRLCLGWPAGPAAAGAAGPLPARADARPRRPDGPAHAARGRPGGAARHPRRAARRGPAHRPLGRSAPTRRAARSARASPRSSPAATAGRVPRGRATRSRRPRGRRSSLAAVARAPAGKARARTRRGRARHDHRRRRQVIGEALALGAGPARVGGLRGGSLRVDARRAALHALRVRARRRRDGHACRTAARRLRITGGARGARHAADHAPARVTGRSAASTVRVGSEAPRVAAAAAPQRARARPRAARPLTAGRVR